MAMEQRGTFSDSWFFDMFSNKETEAMTKALQQSFMTNVTNQSVDDNSSVDFSTDTVESFLAGPELRAAQTAGGFGVGDPVVKRRPEAAPAGRIAKRKSRASKRAAATTFITADPANFRQMVQEVTGVKFGGLDGQFAAAAAQVMKPEPRRAMSCMQGGIGNCLPTLDTSAFLLDQVGSTSSVEIPAGNVPPPPRMTAADSGGGGAFGGFGFESSFYNFPTLESWKAV